MVRDWLSAILSGRRPSWPFADDVTIESILDAANTEGVIALLHDRISAADPSSGIPVSFQKQIAQRAREKAQQCLMREAECRRLLMLLEQTGIQVLLLKGSALAYWAYPSAHLRDCSDIDLLLFSYAETQKAISLLHTLQYSLRDTALPGNLVSFEQTCVRDSRIGAGLEIDLHWRLSSSPIFAYQFSLEELNSSAIPLPKLGTYARGLSPMHAFFNACMHRIQNMADGTEGRLKWLYDLHLLSSQFKESDWQTMAKTAIERQLSGVCWDGLQAAQREFNTVIPESISDKLARASKLERMQISKMHRWFYIQRMSFLAFPTVRLRMRWLRQRLLPNTAYLRARHGGENTAGILLRRVKAGWQRLF